MTPCWLLILLCSPLWHSEGVKGWGSLSTVPSESECRPYIEKALKELSPENPKEAVDATGSDQATPPSQSPDQEGSIEETEEATTKESAEDEKSDEIKTESEETAQLEENEDVNEETSTDSEEALQTDKTTESVESTETQENANEETGEGESKAEESTETEEVKDLPAEQLSSEDSIESTENLQEASVESKEEEAQADESSVETPEESTNEQKSEEEGTKSQEESIEETTETSAQEAQLDAEEAEKSTSEEIRDEQNNTAEDISIESKPEDIVETVLTDTVETSQETTEDHTGEESIETPGGEVTDSNEKTESLETTESTETKESEERETDVKYAEEKEVSLEETTETTEASAEETVSATETSKEESIENTQSSIEETASDEPPINEEVSTEETKTGAEESSSEASGEIEKEGQQASEEIAESTEGAEIDSENLSDTIEAPVNTTSEGESEEAKTSDSEEEEQTSGEEPIKEPEPTVEDQLTLEFETPKVRRPREHIAEILHLSPESAETELLLAKTSESTLKELKRLYDAAIKPLEILFKYRDLSNRHFGDPEIFSKPLILFMGPWSGGKSTILNYLLDNEFKASSLRTGAEPSPAYFNILMWGEREEVLDGTQLAADWTFSGLQKFGQGLLDRLRGLRLNTPLLEKVNIVEIPGILEIRKQVERLFPFNDACQWFIDRADIIFLVYDPSKLDVGPETEAILDQLKGREYQTRIILNKADQVKPEELMRVQGTLIWNISPLMSSQEPPVMYSTSLWSIPYEQGAPSRLLHAQERAFLRDLRTAIDKRVDNKIASARRFAVRVRNHAKMVDCYLTTYYNHKTFFGNRKKVADDIIEHPQNYHIYEGLSTLTNISRYDLPDPEVYRDFFRLNPVYDFQRLSDTCTYFRGCPINRLDVAIAYDLPELVGKYKKQAEKVLEVADKQASKS